MSYQHRSISKFKTTGGDIELPVTSTVSYELDTSNSIFLHEFEVVFYNSSDAVVTPTSGTILIQAALTDDKIYRNISNGVFDAVDVYSDSRAIPIVMGVVSHYKITFTSIVGAEYAVVTVSTVR